MFNVISRVKNAIVDFLTKTDTEDKPPLKVKAQTPAPIPAVQPGVTPTGTTATTPMPSTPCPAGKMWVEDGTGGWVCAGPGEVTKKALIHKYDPNELKMFGEIDQIKDLVRNKYQIGLNIEEAKELLAWLKDQEFTQDFANSDTDYFYAITSWLKSKGWTVQGTKRTADITSILEPLLPEIEKQINTKVPLEEIKNFIIEKVGERKINEEDKRKIKYNVEKLQTPDNLLKYLYNSILKYEGHGVISTKNLISIKIGQKVKIIKDLIYSPKYGGILPKEEYAGSQYWEEDNSGKKSSMYLKKGTIMTALEDGSLDQVEFEGGGHNTSLEKNWFTRLNEGHGVVSKQIKEQGRQIGLKEIVKDKYKVELNDKEVESLFNFLEDQDVQSTDEFYFNEIENWLKRKGRKGQLSSYITEGIEAGAEETLNNDNVFDWTIETFNANDICKRTGLPDDADLLEHKEEISQSFLPSYEEQIENSGFDWLFEDNEDIYDITDGNSIDTCEIDELDEVPSGTTAGRKGQSENLIGRQFTRDGKTYTVKHTNSGLRLVTIQEGTTGELKTINYITLLHGYNEVRSSRAQMEKTVPAPVTPVNPVEPLKPGEIPVILEDEVTDEKAKPKGLNPEEEEVEKKTDLGREEKVKTDVGELKENIINLAKSVYSIEMSEQQVTDLLGKIMGFLSEKISEVTLGRVQDIVGDLLPRKAKLSNRKGQNKYTYKPENAAKEAADIAAGQILEADVDNVEMKRKMIQQAIDDFSDFGYENWNIAEEQIGKVTREMEKLLRKAKLSNRKGQNKYTYKPENAAKEAADIAAGQLRKMIQQAIDDFSDFGYENWNIPYEQIGKVTREMEKLLRTYL